jgi:hypothetical protein
LYATPSGALSFCDEWMCGVFYARHAGVTFPGST